MSSKVVVVASTVVEVGATVVLVVLGDVVVVVAIVVVVAVVDVVVLVGVDVVVVVAGGGVVGGAVGATVVGGSVGAAVVGGRVVGGSVGGAAVVGVDDPEEPPTVVVDSATVVEVVVVVLVDDTLVSGHGSPSGDVVVVLPAVAPARWAGIANRATATRTSTTTSGVIGRPDRCCVSRITPPASTASAPTTTSVLTEPPEIGRSQGWASMRWMPSPWGLRVGLIVVRPLDGRVGDVATTLRFRGAFQSGRRRWSSRSEPASMPGSCTARWPNRSAASSDTIASTSVQSRARGPSLM